MKKLTIILLLLISFGVSGQVVYESVQRTNIYDFLDELANEKIISIIKLTDYVLFVLNFDASAFRIVTSRDNTWALRRNLQKLWSLNFHTDRNDF